MIRLCGFSALPSGACASFVQLPIATQRRHRSPSGRRRFSAANTRGRSDHIRELLRQLKAAKANASMMFDGLHPRDKIDIMRALHRNLQRKYDSGLPKFYSSSFRRSFFFEESDLEEVTTLGRGPGGQATNRRKQTVILKHTPTKLMVKVSRFPSLRLNRRAARELLNLKLEERLAGPRSQLARAARARKRRSIRRARTKSLLTQKGKTLLSREASSIDYYAILKGEKPIPSHACPACASSTEGPRHFFAPVYSTSSLLDTDLRQLWPLLLASASETNPAYSMTSPADPGYDISCLAGRDEALPYQVPLLLRCLFPVSTPGVESELKQLEMCRRDSGVLQRVRALLNCLCDVFGLRLKCKAPNSTLMLCKDGLNWVELQGRLQSREGRLTHVAVLLWSHALRSLSELQLVGEKEAVERFFRQRFKKVKTKKSSPVPHIAPLSESCMCAKDVQKTPMQPV